MRIRVASAVSSVVAGAVIGGLLLAGAGSLHWSGVWVWTGLFGAGGAISSFIVPEAVLAERMRGPVRSGQSGSDRVFVVVFGTLTIAWFSLLAPDHRYSGSTVPAAGQVAGAALFVAANAAIVWVLQANPWASASVRIAPDHAVASSGPYALVRHPMYASVIPYLVGTALLLGSAYPAVAAVPLIIALATRTHIEERSLREGLPGYTQYTAQVRWRMVPGLW